MTLQLQFWTALDYCFLEGGYRTQGDLASAAGVSQATISLMKRRQRNYSTDIQAKVAGAFGYDLVDFLALGRWILQGKDPDDLQSLDIPKERVLFSLEDLSEEPLELLGAFMRQNTKKRYVVAVEDEEIFIGDRSTTRFIEGKRYIVRLDGKLQVRTASQMNQGKVLINNKGSVEMAPGPWPGDWVLGQVVYRGLPEE